MSPICRVVSQAIGCQVLAVGAVLPIDQISRPPGRPDSCLAVFRPHNLTIREYNSTPNLSGVKQLLELAAHSSNPADRRVNHASATKADSELLMLDQLLNCGADIATITAH